jgi:hypothetical protein
LKVAEAITDSLPAVFSVEGMKDAHKQSFFGKGLKEKFFTYALCSLRYGFS